MAQTQETIADIIAEMRALSNPLKDGIIAINGRQIADRLDAARKRDADEIADIKKRVKLWTDRADELRRKCDEQYAKLNA